MSEFYDNKIQSKGEGGMKDFSKEQHMSDIISAPETATQQKGKYWLIDTCPVEYPFAPKNSEKTYETIVVPCSVNGTYREKDAQKPTLVMRHSSTEAARAAHNEIVKILETEKPERVPARLQSFVGEWFVRKSVLDDLHSKQQEVARQGKAPSAQKSKDDPAL